MNKKIKCPKCGSGLVRLYYQKDQRYIPFIVAYCWECKRFFEIKTMIKPMGVTDDK